jgi:endonuclease/exonuclease/phosphatase (EEP) superfamily protein YafD
VTVTAERKQTWDSPAPVRRFQPLLVTIGVLALIPGLAASALRLFPPSDDGPALLASFIPYGLVGYLVAAPFLLVALLRARGGRPALVVVSLICAAGLIYQASAVIPMFVSDRRPATTAPFTVISLNMLNGSSDPAGLARQARQADIVVLVEATPEGVARLERYGWSERFRYAAGSTVQGDTGSVIYSRFPLSNSEPLPPSSFQQWAATADVPDVGPVRIVAVHPCNPYCGNNDWAEEHAEMRSFAADLPADEPAVLAGDFNATNDHGPIMRLRDDGWRSATDVAGGGWLPTYPANRRVPPLIPIDHILINSSLTATSIGTFRVGGTDHFGVQATLAGTS